MTNRLTHSNGDPKLSSYYCRDAEGAVLVQTADVSQIVVDEGTLRFPESGIKDVLKSPIIGEAK